MFSVISSNNVSDGLRHIKQRSPLQEIHVLHIDDDASKRQLTKIFIQNLDPNINVTSVSNAAELIEKLLEEDYDCIISDYKMPEQNGIQIAEKIKSLLDIPYILYTGQGSEEVAEKAFEVGIDDYIRKEMETAHYRVLVKRLKSLVKRKKSENQFTRKN